MQTSYFGRMQSEQFRHLALQGVQISRVCKFWHGRTYPPLFPTWKMIKMNDEQEYRKAYREQILDKLDAQQVWDELGEDAVLLCFEKWDDIESGQTFCHRRIVAEWLEEKLGVTVPEAGQGH